MSVIRNNRIDASNDILKDFAKETSLHWESGVYVSWKLYNGESYCKKWMTRGQDFYPVWYRKWGHGGTACVALAQLVRWIQNKPVLPISSWQYWSQPNVKLVNDSTIIKLQKYDYPSIANCVLCGKDLTEKSKDWWSLDGISGPCCMFAREGCRRKTNESE